MYPSINIDKDVLSRVSLAHEMIPTYLVYNYTLLQCLRAVHYNDYEVRTNIEMFYYYKNNPPREYKVDTSVCPVGYTSCSGCGKCEYF